MATNELLQHKKDHFLETFAKIGNITKSALVCGVGRSDHYYWLDSDKGYAERYGEALKTFCDAIDYEIFRRGVIGVDEPVVYQGQLSRDGEGNLVTVNKKSDTLLIVKAKQMGVFVEKQEHVGEGGGPIPVTLILPDNRRDPPKALKE